MSQSPNEDAEIEDARDPNSVFRNNLNRMTDLVQKGRTFSGLERNCVFLNTNSDRFAKVSAVSGLDFLDDARTHALVDWDQDGDLDLWTANRNAPQIRILRNDIPSDNHFLALKLEGVSCNRDAVGARVEVVLKSNLPEKIVKSVRAGEGFLGQSSKWLHFGLGSSDQIERITIHWPGSLKSQVITDIESDRFYHITQGKIPRPLVLNRTVKPAASDNLPETTKSQARVFLTSRIPLPSFDYRTFDDQERTLEQWFSSPLLINLWASWCIPCVEELKQFTVEKKRLQNAGINILALSVDGLGDVKRPDPNGNRDRVFLEQLKFPFESGIATEKILEILQYLCEFNFTQQRSLPVPTSLLVDRQGQIAVIYRGNVSVLQVISDVEKLSLDAEMRRSESLPFAGLWDRFPNEPSAIKIPTFLIQKGYINETLDFVNRFSSLIESHPGYVKLLAWLGDELFDQGRSTDGFLQYERVLLKDPQNVSVLNNLAWRFAAHPLSSVRDGNKAVYWAQRAAEVVDYKNPTVLDTLAAAYAESGRFAEAVSTLQKAIILAKSRGEKDLLKTYHRRLARYQNQQPVQVNAPDKIRSQ